MSGMYGDPFIEAHIEAANRRLVEQMASLRRQITPDMAANVTDLARQYPTMTREVVTGAALAGVQAGSQDAQDLAMREVQADSDDEGGFWDTVGGIAKGIWNPIKGIFTVPGTLIEPVLRTGFTVFDMMWEEALARPFRTAIATLGLSDQYGVMNPITAWSKTGSSFGARAVAKMLRGEWDDINLGSGFLPKSDMAEDTEEYKNRVARGENPETVRAEIQARLGDPIVQDSRREHETGLTMMGQPISPGRVAVAPLVALDKVIPGGTFFEPGNLAYNLMSGIVDAGVQMSTMRVARIPGRVPGRYGARTPFLAGKAIPGIPEAGRAIPGFLAGKPVPMLGDPAATALKHVSVMRQAARTFDSIDDAAFVKAMQDRGMAPLGTGLVKWVRRSVHSPTADEWLRSPLGQQLTRLIDGEVDQGNMAMLVDWFGRKNPHLDQHFFDDLARTGIGGGLESAEDVMRRAINTRQLSAVPTVMGQTGPFRGLSTALGGRLGAAGAERWGEGFTDVGRALGELGGARAGIRSSLGSYGWGRLFNEMGSRVLDIEDSNAGFMDLNRWMISSGAGVRERSEILTEWVSKASGEFQHLGAWDVAAKAFNRYGKRLEALGLDSLLSDYLVHTFADGEGFRRFFDDESGNPFWAPGNRFKLVKDDGSKVAVLPTPQEISEFLDRAIPLPDAREMRKAQSSIRRWLYTEPGVGGARSTLPADSRKASLRQRFWLKDQGKGSTQRLALNENVVQRVLDQYTQRYWKPMTLLRIAWPIRVIGEEQVRGAAAGLDSLFSHPVRAISWMISDPNANRFTKAMQTLGVQPRGRVLSSLDLGDVNDVEALRATLTAEGLSDEDVLVHLSEEFEKATHLMGDMWGGIWENPVAHSVWGTLNKADTQAGRGAAPTMFGPSWLNELVQMHRDPVTRLIAADRTGDTARAWLRSDAGVKWRRGFASRLHDVNAKGGRPGIRQRQILSDDAVDAIVDSRRARLYIKTGGTAGVGVREGRNVRPISGSDAPQTLTGADRALLEDPSRYSELEYWFDDSVDAVLSDDLWKFVATGDWKGVGNITSGARRPQLDQIATDLMDRYFKVAPGSVKGPLEGSAKRLGQGAYDRIVRVMFDHLMTQPTGVLSRSPAFKQFIWKFLTDSAGFNSPAVNARVLQAARNADLPRDMMRQLEIRVAAAERTVGYGVLNDAMQARADKILRVNQASDDDLMGMIRREGILDEALGADDPEAWFTARIRKTNDDHISEADLAVHELWTRHSDDDGFFTPEAITGLNERLAGAYGIDQSPASARNTRLLEARAADVSWQELAAEFGVSVSTVRRWHKTALVAGGSRVQQAAALQAAGVSVKEIAARLGVTETTARRWIKEGATGDRVAGLLDEDTNALFRLMENDEVRFHLDDHLDRHTDLVDGTRRARTSHGFDDITDTEGGYVRDGFQELIDLAKAHALEEVQRLLYDTSKKHHIMDMMRNVFPFGQAWVEVLSTWSRLIAENPQILRRGQQIIEGAREADPTNSGRGFFFTDPQTGEEVFNFPFSGALFNMATGTLGKAGQAAGAAAGAVLGAPAGPGGAAAGGGLGAMLGGSLPNPFGGSILGTSAAPGQAGEPGFRMQGSVAGLNLFAGSYIPGFGPVIQIAATQLFGDDPTFDTIKSWVLPFGDQKISSIGDLADLSLPRWATSVFAAAGARTPEQKRIYASTVMDVFRTILLAEGEPRTGDGIDRMMDRAKGIASKLALYRAYAYIFSPTAPQMRFETKDRNGDLWLFQSLASEYRRILYEKHDGDDVAAFEDFTKTFGMDPTLFATSKSITIAPRNVTVGGDKWARDHKDLFEKAPSTAYYANPDDPTDESFDYNAYTRQLEEGTRAGLTPEQWWSRRNDTLGRVMYEKTRRELDDAFGPKTDARKTVILRLVRHWLIDRWPGYQQPIPGAPQSYTNDQKQRELREVWLGQVQDYWPNGSVKWVDGPGGGTPELRDSEAGKALRLWYQAVDRFEGTAVERGYTAEGLWSAKGMLVERETLRQYADILMRNNEDFMLMYRMILEHSFPEDDFGLNRLGVGAVSGEEAATELSVEVG